MWCVGTFVLRGDVENRTVVPGPENRTRFVLAITVIVALLGTTFLIFRPGDQASAGVAFADPEAWIEHGLEGELLKVNGSTGEVTTRIEVAEAGDDLAVAPHGSGAALLNRTAGQLLLIDGQRLTTALQLDLELSSSEEDRALQVHPSPNFDSPVIVSDTDQIMVIDPQTSLVESIPLANPLTSSGVETSGRLIALTNDTNSLVSLVGQRLDELETLPPAVDEEQPRHVVAAGGNAFVVDPARLLVNQVLENGELGQPFCLSGSTVEGATFGGTEANDEPVIVSFNSDLRIVALSGPNDGCDEITVDINPSDEFGEPVVHQGFVYLPNYTQSQVHVVDIAEEAEVSVFSFGTNGVPFDLSLRGAAVWANQPLGASAAVIDGGEITRVVKIDSVVAGSVAFDPDGEEGDDAVGRGDEAAEDRGGLRILGASGEAVLAAGEDPGDSPDSETAEDGSELDEPVDADPEVALEPLGVGVSAEVVATPEPVPEPEALIEEPEETEEIIANFAASAVTANVGESIRFTDFSSGTPTSWTWDFGDGTGARDIAVVEKSWDEGGDYIVSLIVRNGAGDEASQSVQVTIVPEAVEITPTADFGFDRNTVEVGESVTFTDRSTGSPTSLQWDFGDGSGDLGGLVTHRYEESGTYTVTLTAASEVGSTTASTIITVLSGVDPPEAVIGDLPVEITDGQLVTFTSLSRNDPTSVLWDFGDGTEASGQTVRHRWEDPGTYRVRLEVSNSAGSDSTFIDVQVLRRLDPPAARFTQTATEVLVDEVVTFTDLSTNAPTSWDWDFGDGTTRRGEMVNKRWSEPGTYRVTLDAANAAGSDQTRVTITVLDPVDPPSAAFALSAGVVAPGDIVSLTDQSQNTPTAWAWDLGDGTTSAQRSPNHAYQTPGTYQVSLQVSNEGGTSMASQQVIVVNRPVANFDFAIDGRTVTFTDTSTNADSWAWDFGDGNTSTQRAPRHTFGTGGGFNVTLTVRNQLGASQPRTAQIQISEPPVAVATCTVVDRTLQCDGSQSQNAVSFLWENGNEVVNTTPNAAQTVFAWNSNGRRTIQLTVTSADGQTSETTLRSEQVLRGLQPQISDVNVTQEGDLLRLQAVVENDPVTWTWELDGADLVQGGNGPTAVFRVPDDGRFTGSVSAENAFGRDTDPLTINVDSFDPEASFTWAVIEPGVVELLNTSTAQAGASFIWATPGREEIISNNAQRRVVRYPEEGGSFTVRLEATDAFGSDTFETTINVPAIGQPPVASFTWEVVGPGLVRFDNTSEAADDFAVTWRTPGGLENVTRNRATTTVQYPLEGGRFDVSLEVRDDFGTDTFETTIQVPAVDQGTVLGFTLSVIEPGVVEAINTSTAGAGAAFRWVAVGDDEVLVRSDERFVVRFDEGGTYEVRLFVEDDFGDDRLFQDIRVPDF